MMSNGNEKTDQEREINRKLDALKESVELLAGGTEKGRWKAVEGVRSAWKEEEE